MLFQAYQTRSWKISRASTLVNFLGPSTFPWVTVKLSSTNQLWALHCYYYNHPQLQQRLCTQVLFVFVAAIGNAFAVLSNPEKRLRYDEYGDEQVTFTTPRARPYNYYRDFEADITPEELFNVFFGGHFPTG